MMPRLPANFSWGLVNVVMSTFHACVGDASGALYWGLQRLLLVQLSWAPFGLFLFGVLAR